MNTPDSHDKMTRWLDGFLTPAESEAFRAELQENPELHGEAQSLQLLRSQLREHLPPPAPLPHADFFNSEIQERIGKIQREEEQARVNRAPARGWVGWLLRPWLIPTAAMVVAVGFLAWHAITPDENTQVLNFYTPNANVHATTFHSDEANATVLILDGLDAVPDDKPVSDKPVSGLGGHRSGNAPEMASAQPAGAPGGLMLAMVQ